MIQSDGLWDHIYSRLDRPDSSAKHLLRRMEFLSNPSNGLRVVAAHYIGAYLLLIIPLHFQLDIQCLFFVWYSESHFHFGIQSRILDFSIRIRRLSLVRHSEPSFIFSVWLSKSHFYFGIQSRILSFGIQSRHLSLVRHSEPPCLFFFWHSESHFHFGVQSRIFSLTFKYVICL